VDAIDAHLSGFGHLDQQQIEVALASPATAAGNHWPPSVRQAASSFLRLRGGGTRPEGSRGTWCRTLPASALACRSPRRRPAHSLPVRTKTSRSQSVLCHPSMRGSVRNSGSSRHGQQRLVLFKVRLEQTEPIERQSPGGIREARQFVHTRTVCQIFLTDLCHLILKVTNASSVGADVSIRPHM
jgi:hypothetical protein